MQAISIYIRFLFQRLFVSIGLIVIVVGGYVCKVNHISFGLLNFICYISHEDEKNEFWLYQVEYLIFVFIVTTIATIILIYFYKNHKNKRRKIRKKYIDLFVKSIFSYLYAETTLEQMKKMKFLYKLWKRLRNEYAKRLYLNLLRQIYLETEGEIHDRIDQFINGLEYNSFIRAYFLSPFLRNNLFSLKFIRDFKIQGYEKDIINLIHRVNLIPAKVKLIKPAALATLIQIEKFNDLLFLVENQIDISTWETNFLIISLPISCKDKIHYKALISSNLTSLSTLGIILANLNGKNEFKNDIKSKIIYDRYNNEEAILAFASFADDLNDFEFLISIFKVTTEIAQIRILKLLIKCSNVVLTTQFLERVVKNDSYPLKIAAIQSLLQLDMFIILKLKKSDNIVVRQACNHVLDFNM